MRCKLGLGLGKRVATFAVVHPDNMVVPRLAEALEQETGGGDCTQHATNDVTIAERVNHGEEAGAAGALCANDGVQRE